MPNRTHQIFTGKTFKVPTHIVRLDSKSTHGWQLRYGTSKLFSDHTSDGSGAAKSLKAAKEELALRLEKLPAPTGLRVDTRKGKLNNMPLGISGPVSRVRAGRGVTQHYLQVTFPMFGGKPVNRSIYIATEATLTKEKYDQAMEKAIALRASGVRKFKLASTKVQRGEPLPAPAAPAKKVAAKKAAVKAAVKVVAAPKAVAKKAVAKKAVAKKAVAKKAAGPAKPSKVSMKSLVKPVKAAKAAPKAVAKKAAKPAVKAAAKPVVKAAKKAAKKVAKQVAKQVAKKATVVTKPAKAVKSAKARKSK